MENINTPSLARRSPVVVDDPGVYTDTPGFVESTGASISTLWIVLAIVIPVAMVTLAIIAGFVVRRIRYRRATKNYNADKLSDSGSEYGWNAGTHAHHTHAHHMHAHSDAGNFAAQQAIQQNVTMPPPAAC